MAKNDRRLIDANQLPKRRLEIKDINRPEPYIFDVVFLADLEKAETVDAVEVAHGRWEEHARDTFAKEHRCEKLRCTHCWHFFYHNYGDNKLYCPGCGAKMDGGPGNAEN